jgi:hypothetical protein
VKTSYIAWAVVSVAIVAGTVYLCVRLNPWFVLMLFAIPEIGRDVDAAAEEDE